jgi:hypothetical protein
VIRALGHRSPYPAPVFAAPLFPLLADLVPGACREETDGEITRRVDRIGFIDVAHWLGGLQHEPEHTPATTGYRIRPRNCRSVRTSPARECPGGLVVVLARTAGDKIEIHFPKGWKPMQFVQRPVRDIRPALDCWRGHTCAYA